MRDYESLVRDIRENSRYLLDREGYIETIFDRLKRTIPFAALGVTGVSGTGYDMRALTCGYPAEYLAIYVNKDHEKCDFYRENIRTARRVGISTVFRDNVRMTFPQDYEERYRKFGFQCGVETVYCDPAGNRLGLWAGIKSVEAHFSNDENAAVLAVAPYVFSAFLRYRWLVGSDLFTLVCFDEFPLGIVACGDTGRITFTNEPARQSFLKHEGRIPEMLPPALAGLLDRTRAYGEGRIDDVRHLFQEIETYVPPLGSAICCRFSPAIGGRYLPVKGAGWAFFLDARKRDMEKKTRLSSREVQVIRLMGQGLQDKEIAAELGISLKTVQTYVQKLFIKLDAHNRTEAVVIAINLGLL